MACLFCDATADSCEWCAPGGRLASGIPLTQSMSAQQQRRALLGVHPMGAQLAPPGHPGHGLTCGDCRHLYAKHRSKTYLKCKLNKNTNSKSTDTRAKWPACILWEEA